MLFQMFLDFLKFLDKGILELLDILFNGISTKTDKKNNAKFLSNSDARRMLNTRNKRDSFGIKRISVEQSLEYVLVCGARGFVSFR